jgi:hypothetical protein
MKRLYRRIAVPLVGAVALVSVLTGPAVAATVKPVPQTAFTTIGTITALNAGARTVTFTVQMSSLDRAGESLVASLPAGTSPLVNGKSVLLSALPLGTTAVLIGVRSSGKSTVSRVSAVKR